MKNKTATLYDRYSRNPINVGRMNDPSGAAWIKGFCDDTMEIYVEIEGNIVKEARFYTDGCAATYACGSEMLDPIVPQYIADLISWASIGARTAESQTHREMASGLSMPVGFKNGTSGDFKTAINAMQSARHPHHFIGIDQNGTTSVIRTSGNPSSHIVLRGGSLSPNYYEENIEIAEKMILDSQMEPAIIIDCSHANSRKQYNRQERVLRSILDQKKRGRNSIVGFMLESNLVASSQSLPENLDDLVYGQSITDECLGWEETEVMLLSVYKMIT